MGGLLTLTSFLKYFPQIDSNAPGISAAEASKRSNVQGITVGGYTLGCFFGAVATIWLGNLLGRKRTIMVGSTIMVVGATIQASSYSLGQLIAARLITGFGNGMNTSTVPMWQGETSKSHRRGQMVMIEGSLIVFGVMVSTSDEDMSMPCSEACLPRDCKATARPAGFETWLPTEPGKLKYADRPCFQISYWIDLGFSFLDPSSAAWRFPIAFQILLALIVLFGIPGLPESPRWLILKGRDQRAIEVLAALSDLPQDDPRVQNEFKAIKDVVLEGAKGSFADAFKFNRNRNAHRTVLAYVNQMFQQISGINIISMLPWFSIEVYR